MMYRSIDFALLGLYLLMFKVCGIIGIPKIEFFNFLGTERIKENKKKIKNLSKPHQLVSQSLTKQFQQNVQNL